MNGKAKSPRIDHVSWGHMEVEGLGKGRDFKLFPGGGRAWDWTDTGMRHVPGIQPADVQELLDNGSEVVVLSRGMQLVLRTCPETLDMLRARGIRTHVEETNRGGRSVQPVGGDGGGRRPVSFDLLRWYAPILCSQPAGQRPDHP